jgi:hypothetical protein
MTEVSIEVKRLGKKLKRSADIEREGRGNTQK